MSDDARMAVAVEALSWIGTPYHPHGAIKGAGVDCAQILRVIFCDTLALVPPIDPGVYPMQHHLHRSEELYREWLVRAGAHPVQAPALGDIALIKFGRTFSHSAICAGDLWVHAYADTIQKVIASRLTEAPLAGRPIEYWSIF